MKGTDGSGRGPGGVRRVQRESWGVDGLGEALQLQRRERERERKVGSSWGGDEGCTEGVGAQDGERGGSWMSLSLAFKVILGKPYHS